MDNARFHGEDGELRRKTELCKAFKRGDCHWGAQCNYAHSEEELQTALKKLGKSKAKGKQSALNGKTQTKEKIGKFVDHSKTPSSTKVGVFFGIY